MSDESQKTEAEQKFEEEHTLAMFGLAVERTKLKKKRTKWLRNYNKLQDKFFGEETDEREG